MRSSKRCFASPQPTASERGIGPLLALTTLLKLPATLAQPALAPVSLTDHPLRVDLNRDRR